MKYEINEGELKKAFHHVYLYGHLGLMDFGMHKEAEVLRELESRGLIKTWFSPPWKVVDGASWKPRIRLVYAR